jgi:hypothetical protein
LWIVRGETLIFLANRAIGMPVSSKYSFNFIGFSLVKFPKVRKLLRKCEKGVIFFNESL